MNRPNSTKGSRTHVLATIAKTTGLGVVFVLAAAGGAILHLGLPAPRRFVAARVNDILEGTFKGKITVQRVGLLRLTQLSGVDAEVFDPEGHRVLALRGVRARFGTLTVLRSLVSGDALIVRIPELSIDAAEAALEENAAGELGLQRAFESREPSTGKPGRETRVSIPEIHLEHAWIHGHMAAVPLIDADLDDFAGAFALTAKTTSIDVKRLLVRGRGLPGMNPEGAVEASASLPSDPGDKMRVRAHYEGQVGEVPVRADGSLTGKEVVVVVDVPDTMPDAIAAISSGKIHLGAAVSAHAEVHGELPVLRPELSARIGESEITASGTVTLPEEPRNELIATIQVNAKNLDVSLLQEGAPRSRLTATVDASVVSRPEGKLTGSFHLQNQVGQVSGQVVPAASVQGAFTEQSVRGTGHIAERGAPTTVWFSLSPRDGGASPTELAFRVETMIADLDAIRRLGPIGRGRAHIVAQGSMDIETQRFSTYTAADAFGLDMNGVKLERGFITVAAEGALDAPRFAADLYGAGMSAGGYTFPSVGASVSGSPQELDVSARLVGDDQAPTVGAGAHVSTRGDLMVRGASIELKRGDVTSTTKIASVRVAGGAVDIRGVTAYGLGAPVEASARISAAGITVKAKGPDVDLSRVAKLLAREEDARGHLAFDVDAIATRREAKGRMDVEISDLSVRGVQGAKISVSTSMEGKRFSGHVLAAIGDVGRIELTAPDIDLGGPVTAPSAWRTAAGSVALTGAVDLDRLLSQVAPDSRPVEAASGTIAIRGEASRLSRSSRPFVEFEAKTNGLALVAKQAKQRNADGSITLGPEPWRTVGLDGSLAIRLTGSTDHTQISAELHDKHGSLASVDASASLPIAEILKSPDRLLALVGDAPIEAKIAVPRRSLDAMPQALGTPPLKGDVELSAQLQGTTRAPRFTLTAKATNLLPRGVAPCVRRVDVETNVAYDGQKADVRVAASRDGREFMGGDATVKVSAAQAMAGGAIDWDASGNVALKSLPLDAVGAFLHRPIGGSVSGKVAIKDLHRAASLSADLDLQGLTLDRAAFPRGKVHVRVKEGTLSASARLDQADGYLETRATGAIAWGAALAPALDPAKPVDVAVRAKNFRAAAAAPFVQDSLSELDGFIDADAQLHIERGGKDGHMNGAVVIRDGVFELPQIGERFHDLRGRVIIKPWGTVRFEEFSAKAPTGEFTAAAQAVLDGLEFRRATAKIHIAKGRSIPIALEGVPMGRAYGDVTANAQMSKDGKRLDIDVDVPVLHIALPQSTGHAVQPLEPDHTVRIGQHRGSEFVSIPLAPPEEPRAPSDLRIRLAVKLGDDVEVKRDTTVAVAAQGRTVIEVSDKAHVSGQIRLKGGKLELQGRKFIIDRGVVSLVGPDPADPIIVATAYWDAPDGTRVYADFSGRVTSGKLSLRAEPSLTQDEILALILFGSRDGSFGAEPPPGQEASTGVKAAGMAGGVVTEGVNKAISGITTADITTRVDTSKADNPRPELAVQISKKVSARLGYKLGVPTPGENPDRTELTLDWRFIRNWSLVAVVGDQGSTSLDVVWRLRY